IHRPSNQEINQDRQSSFGERFGEVTPPLFWRRGFPIFRCWFRLLFCTFDSFLVDPETNQNSDNECNRTCCPFPVPGCVHLLPLSFLCCCLVFYCFRHGNPLSDETCQRVFSSRNY